MSGDVVHQAASSPQGGEKSPNISIKPNLKTTEEHLNDQSVLKKSYTTDQLCQCAQAQVMMLPWQQPSRNSVSTEEQRTVTC